MTGALQRVATCLVLTVVASCVLVGCSSGTEVDELSAESVADLSGVEGVTELRRHEVEPGASLGKPVHAEVSVAYAVDGDPAEVLDQVLRLAADDGWLLEEPNGSSVGTVVLGEKELPSGTGQLGLTLVPAGRAEVSGIDGPALLSDLELVPSG